MQFTTLNNGVKIPLLGFGTFQIPNSKDCEDCVEYAIECGYRLIDTASLYKNETSIGNAVQHARINREDMVLTSKVWPQDHGYENTLQAFEQSRKNLGVDYIDLYMIHQPYGDYYGSWRAMEKLLQEGLVKAIGVCNFSAERLVDFCMNQEVMPAINQVEIHPFFQQKDLIEIMEKYQIHQEAWGPLCEGQMGIFDNPTLKKIADEYDKTVAQIINRWHIQKGNIIIPRSVQRSHILENISIWDFELSEKDMYRIELMDLGHSEIIDHCKPSTAKWINEWKIHD
ncbi:MAG: aldo/keto reductase [bacterium]|nr:aldo/keto reductase [bacterium]